ncbi:hypothetical protein OPS25_10550 [Alteromonas ponticola]|uniref:PEP-CTERM sorting domain-containing protein n=1 Tax=Alteromonas aquimaris TaxID=2998417 RepID=A0ABT3P851_9ALTE|nr:hypothetical protein [Alteromonas aquimaris]MCW8108932.1 hypothetical protein [Alteromonas aquimaris]
MECKYNKMVKVVTFCCSLVGLPAFGALLSVDVQITDNVETVVIDSVSDQTYNSVDLVDLQLQFNIDFERSPLSSEPENGPIFFTHTSERSGVLYSYFAAEIYAEWVPPTSPFTNDLLSLIPWDDESALYIEQKLSFYQQIAVDIESGELLEENSFKYFRFTKSFGSLFTEDFEKMIGQEYAFERVLHSHMEVTYQHDGMLEYSMPQVENMLFSSSELNFRYNELFHRTTYDLANDNQEIEHYMYGYVGNGVSRVQVSEPQTAIVVALGLLAFFARRK